MTGGASLQGVVSQDLLFATKCVGSLAASSTVGGRTIGVRHELELKAVDDRFIDHEGMGH